MAAGSSGRRAVRAPTRMAPFPVFATCWSDLSLFCLVAGGSGRSKWGKARTMGRLAGKLGAAAAAGRAATAQPPVRPCSPPKPQQRNTPSYKPQQRSSFLPLHVPIPSPPSLLPSQYPGPLFKTPARPAQGKAASPPRSKQWNRLRTLGKLGALQPRAEQPTEAPRRAQRTVLARVALATRSTASLLPRPLDRLFMGRRHHGHIGAQVYCAMAPPLSIYFKYLLKPSGLAALPAGGSGHEPALVGAVRRGGGGCRPDAGAAARGAEPGAGGRPGGGGATHGSQRWAVAVWVGGGVCVCVCADANRARLQEAARLRQIKLLFGTLDARAATADSAAAGEASAAGVGAAAAGHVTWQSMADFVVELGLSRAGGKSIQMPADAHAELDSLLCRLEGVTLDREESRR